LSTEHLPGLLAVFSWAGDPYKRVTYSAVHVPNSSSPRFSVSLAYALEWPHPFVRWLTPDLPGIPAGEPGGPLSIDFKNGYIGADVYIKGYLYRTN
jgi:hypothetical protein